MEKKGKDRLTQYERHFAKVKECNEQYEQKLLLASYKAPTFDQSKKMAVEHSIRRIIGANYGHKPTVTLAKAQIIDKGRKLQEADEIVGINVTFSYKNDFNSFAKLLAFKKHDYDCTFHLKDKEIDKLLKSRDEEEVRATIKPNKYTAFMAIDQAEKFIKNTLQIEIDSVEQLGQSQNR